MLLKSEVTIIKVVDCFTTRQEEGKIRVTVLQILKNRDSSYLSCRKALNLGMISKLLEKMSTRAHSLVDYVNETVRLNDEIKEAVSKTCQIQNFEKGELLIKQDRIAHRIFFIEKGSARTFYYHDGKDVTSWIYREGQFITSWSSFYTRTPSYENVELTEDATVASISYDHLHQLYQQYPRMQQFGRVMVEEQLVFLDYFYKGFMFMTAKEKYDLLLSIFPDMTQRVNLGHIASFLGISQETLSRIRKKKN